MTLLEIRDLHLSMRSFEGELPILKGIDVKIERNEIWGMVGETGSGKSLTGLSVSRLIPPGISRYLRGEVLFEGRDLLKTSEREMRKLRGRKIGMIFQDPTTNLNPAFRISTQLIDVALHAAESDPGLLGLTAGASRRQRRAAARTTAIEMLGRVGITDPVSRIDAYPHQFSGGMRQRMLIAMAMIGQPDLLIADEPTTALDVSVQAQILKLIYNLVAERNIGVLLITHNLGVVAQVCTHVAVMYRGRILEAGKVRDVLKHPNHPYTAALMAAVPTAHTVRGSLQGIGDIMVGQDT